MDFKKTPPICNFNELRQQMFELLESRNYSANAINTHRKTANLLEKFLVENDISFYNYEVGEAFLVECKRYRGNYQGTKPKQTDTMRSMIRLFNCILNGDEYTRVPNIKYVCPDNFTSELVLYLEFQLNSGKKEVTVSKMRSGCSQFLIILEKMGISSLSEITPQKIYSAMIDFSSQIVFGLYIPPFLKYLSAKGIVKADYSDLIPSGHTDTLVPTIYEKNEIESLLSAVDRTQMLGKRNYAMLLFAARLGIRVSDIVNMTFDNIDFKGKMIKFVQIKTGLPLKLPLLAEVETAIKDYLTVRPKSTIHNQIFLRCKAPYFPINRTAVFDAMQKYVKIAKINTKGKKHGAHSLRSSLASALVSENVPYSVTQKILGHNGSNAIKHYVRLDMEHLRECALTVPVPTGEFSVLLGMRGVRS
jgi:integrase/recombinase XerD